MANRTQFGRGASGGGIPQGMTMILLIVFCVSFVLSWIPQIGEPMRVWLGLTPSVFLPWTLFTYPFVGDGRGDGLLFFLIGMMWWYWVGQGLESVTGKIGLLLNFIVFALLTGLAVLAAKAMGLASTSLIGPFLPISAMTVIFCARSPEQEIRFWGIIPLKLKWLALVTLLMVIFGFGTGNPLFGLVVGLPLVLAWFYGGGKLPIRLAHSNMTKVKSKRRENKEFDIYISKVKSKEKDREERERLRKLFESSVEDDDRR